MEPLDFEHDHRAASAVNVADAERIASTFTGAALAAWSLAGLAGRPSAQRWLTLAAGGGLIYRGLTGHCSLYRNLGINTARSSSSAVGVRARRGCKVEHSLAIQRPAEELFSAWRDVAKLAGILRHVESVEEMDDRRSHWVARGPMRTRLEWDAEIINERKPDLIAWRSLPGSEVDTAGSIHFRPLANQRGTLVTVSLKYDPPGGRISAALAEMLDAGLETRIKEDLRRFKNLAEAGEIPTTKGQPHG